MIIDGLTRAGFTISLGRTLLDVEYTPCEPISLGLSDGLSFASFAGRDSKKGLHKVRDSDEDNLLKRAKGTDDSGGVSGIRSSELVDSSLNLCWRVIDRW